MGPMAGVTLVTLLLLAVVDIWLVGRQAQRQIERQWQETGETLQRSTFPLTENVLLQLRGLSGAEYLLVDTTGKPLAATPAIANAAPDFASEWAETAPSDTPESPSTKPLSTKPLSTQSSSTEPSERQVWLDHQPYLHTSLRLRRPVDGGRVLVLHSFYPEARFQRAWRDAVVPPLAVGLSAVAAVMLVGGGLALRVTRPVARLRDQVDRIAAGQYEPLPLPGRDDELRDLTRAVNQLAERLVGYESRVRRQEQLRTLDQLAGGMAHQLRNAVTGCRMALDLHRRACGRSDDEALDVAGRQLESIEEYVRRFLALGRGQSGPLRPLDWTDVIAGVLPLIQPRCGHLGVELRWVPPAGPAPIRGDADSLAQLAVNLLLNAVEAAAEASTRRASSSETQLTEPRLTETRLTETRLTERGATERGVTERGATERGATERGATEHGVVEATLRVGADLIEWEVSDTGMGPPESVRDRVFEPLVSSKPDGAGLGLAIAREVAERHGGGIAWRREGGWTRFTVRLPRWFGEAQ
ncbi:MAG: Sensor protein ZraS [Planctomycetota bacterium]